MQYLDPNIFGPKYSSPVKFASVLLMCQICESFALILAWAYKSLNMVENFSNSEIARTAKFEARFLCSAAPCHSETYDIF